MRLISNRRWNVTDIEKRNKIKNWLLSNGGEEVQVTAPSEEWRIKFSDATVTQYTKGTLFITDSNDESVLKAHNFITKTVGSNFIPSQKKYLIGFDEAGKGEVFGHTILVGVIVPSQFYNEIERDVGVANTKVKHQADYWDEIFNKIDYYANKGLEFLVQSIPPWQVDKYNINKLLDVTYQRMLSLLIRNVSLPDTRIVIDDYGIGFNLDTYLKSLERQGTEIIRTSKADDTYLESRVASLIAKREQQRVIGSIKSDSGFQINGISIGSGNAGDRNTLAWLKAWKASGQPWPWFVKRSFKTIVELDGRAAQQKMHPPINENLLSKEFRQKFESGELNIGSLSVNCPCGASSKAIKLIPLNSQTTPTCVSCKKEIPDIAMTLQYFCGRIIPDTNVIARGFITKDLEGKRFFENFTFLLHPTVRYECDKHSGTKKELEKIGHFAAIGRIRLEEIKSKINSKDLDSVERDDSILKSALENNSIVLTADNGMKGAAQSKGLFVMEI
ncbi:hypothetical protein [Candidatus Nitrosotenuis uzonensis]|uniref:Ribonuclease n=1 Tax=Candidatus Nitrosotenuis uzonensis TaxID=1407055 RepID=A0A812F601_9ARCH|nr:hypothetical protein [Candidatus Nitrosotenuis uzonensis]CAE6500797.1 Ribonuclease [Candidatus Nitrosotenuis uzonensis]